MAAVLLDTCALIWLANGDDMKRAALDAILDAGATDGILVSPVSAWEVGLLARARRQGTGLDFLPDAKTWFSRVMTGPGIRAPAFEPAIAIDASHLPGELHGDLADRMIIATARHYNVPIVTRDRRIRDYAHVGVIAC